VGKNLIYKAKTQRGILGFFLAITVASFSTENLSGGLLFFRILITVFILVAIFIQYKFKIDDGHLTYQILFLTVPIYKKVVYPNQIIQIKFKRVGWAKKATIIQVKKGVNIRLVNFVPNNIFGELINFANKYSISISKTRDYLILEK